MKVISYFTLNTPYEDEARILEKSLKQQQVDYVIRGLPARDSWVENCAQKARFVRDMWAELDESFWWLDADAELCKPLPDLGGQGVDIAAHNTDGWNLNSGTVFFAHTDAAKAVIDLWCEYSEAYPFVWDQLLLMIAVHNVRCEREMGFRDLPVTYYKRTKSRPLKRFKHAIFMGLGLEDKPIVRQNQASRRLKEPAAKVAKPKEFRSDDTPEKVRDILKFGKQQTISMADLFDGYNPAE